MRLFEQFNKKWRSFVKKQIIDDDPYSYQDEPIYGDWKQWEDYYMNESKEKNSMAIVVLGVACILILSFLIYMFYKVFNMVEFYMNQ